MSFYNTIEAEGTERKKYHGRTLKQDELVLRVFKRFPNEKMTPIQICLDHLKYVPERITSIRRAITNLTIAGEITKLTEKRMERYGTSNHLWKLNQTNLPTQKSLFE